MLRLFDILLSTIAILALSPLLAIVMVVLRFTGENEVFYRQERIGKGGKPFHVLKFATMLKDSPKMEGGYLTRSEDPRVLPVGKVLRKWKINELPQLFNVWAGEMSLVGPRPQAPVHYDLYSDDQKRAIDTLTPGLTGLGSIVFRDEERLLRESRMDSDYVHDCLVAPYKGDLERWYASNHSVANYFKILILTMFSLFSPTGNYLRFFRGVPEPDSPLRTLMCDRSE